MLVKNSCETLNGEREVANGAGKVVDTKTNAKLKVTFVKIVNWILAFAGDYWIIDLPSDFSYVVIGGPTTKYAWILSRQPTLDLQTLEGIESRLKSNGFDTCQLLMTVRSGGYQERKPLCEIF